MEPKFLPKIPKRKITNSNVQTKQNVSEENIKVEKISLPNTDNVTFKPIIHNEKIEAVKETPVIKVDQPKVVAHEKQDFKNVNDDNLTATVTELEDKPKSFTFLFCTILCALSLAVSIYMLASLNFIKEVPQAFTSTIDIAFNHAFLIVGILTLLIVAELVLTKNISAYTKNTLTQKVLTKRMIWSSIILFLGFALSLYAVKNIESAIWPILLFIMGIATFIAFVYSLFIKIRSMLK